MKKYSLLAAVAMLSVSAFTSCSKDDDPAPVTRTDLITARNWQVTAFTAQEGTRPVQDIYKGLEECERDDIFQFKADKTLVVDQGKTRCDQDDPQTSISGWDINADGTILLLLEMKGATNAQLFEIKEINKDKMRIGQFVDDDGYKVVTDITFTAR